MTTFNYLLSKHILGIFGPLPTYTVLHIYTQLLFWTGNQGNKSWPFWIFLNIIFFSSAPWKSVMTSKDGSKFWWLFWFPAQDSKKNVFITENKQKIAIFWSPPLPLQVLM